MYEGSPMHLAHQATQHHGRRRDVDGVATTVGRIHVGPNLAKLEISAKEYLGRLCQ
jgi:hypothetical protein